MVKLWRSKKLLHRTRWICPWRPNGGAEPRPAAAERNFDRWKILNVKSPFTQTPYITIATSTYPEQIVALKTFLRERAAWMDQNLRE